MGLGGFRRLCELSGAPHCFTQAFDSEESLKPYYTRLAKKSGSSAAGPGLYLGLHPTEAFTAGPPCQPWASDERSGVMDCCVSWIIHLAWLGQLVAFCMENSSRLRGTGLQRLRVCLPFFVLEVQVRNLSQIFPHNRECLWIRGLRRGCLQGMPREQRFGWQGSLSNPFGLVCATLRPTKAVNWHAVQPGRLHGGNPAEVAICELDRSPLKDFCSHVVYDYSPALRTQGPKLWVMLCSDVKKQLPWQEHRLHRFKAQRSGSCSKATVPGPRVTLIPEPKAAKAAGNAYQPLELGGTRVGPAWDPRGPAWGPRGRSTYVGLAWDLLGRVGAAWAQYSTQQTPNNLSSQP